jgi:hypothetical protein
MPEPKTTVKATRKPVEGHSDLFTFVEVKRDLERERRAVETIIRDAEKLRTKLPDNSKQ